MKPKQRAQRVVERELEHEAAITEKQTHAWQDTFRIYEADLRAALQRLETNYAQLEQTQSQVRAILDASPDALLFLTPDGRPTRINRRFTDFFGLDDATVLSQAPDQLIALLRGVFVPDDTVDRWLTWSTTDQAVLFREPQLRVAFSLREVELSSRPVINVDQRYLGRLYVWHDVTQERETERMRADVASMVTHDLRSPLTSIQLYVQVLLKEHPAGSLTPMQRDYLDKVQRSVERLIRLTADLLDLSHLESGLIKLERTPLDLASLLQMLLPTFEPTWSSKRQTFTLYLPEQGPLVLGDADRVAQIFTNLLSNAHKYTPEGGHIDLSVETIDSVACISVADTGIGLSAQEQAQIFTRFYRARTSMAKAAGGTGLGLAITRTLVEMQGGTIQVDSAPGHGSTFRLTLPLVQQLAPVAQ